MAPFGDVSAHVVTARWARGCVVTDRGRVRRVGQVEGVGGSATVVVVALGGIDGVALEPVEPMAGTRTRLPRGGPLPLRLRGQAVSVGVRHGEGPVVFERVARRQGLHFAQPVTVRCRPVPGDVDNGVIGHRQSVARLGGEDAAGVFDLAAPFTDQQQRPAAEVDVAASVRAATGILKAPLPQRPIQGLGILCVGHLEGADAIHVERDVVSRILVARRAFAAPHRESPFSGFGLVRRKLDRVCDHEPYHGLDDLLVRVVRAHLPDNALVHAGCDVRAHIARHARHRKGERLAAVL